MSIMRRIALIVRLFPLSLILLHGILPAQSLPGSDTVRQKLIVGTKEAPPFSMKRTDGTWEGISIDLWHDVAEEVGVVYELRETDLHGLLEGVATDSFDLSIAAITITSDREEAIDFTHPYFQAGLGIAVNVSSTESMFSMAKRLFSMDFMSAIGALLFILLLVGVVIWLVERKRNPEQFGGSVVEGIGSGFWWSAVTMTTVGYGDKAPVTFAGRLIGLIWMFAAIIIISSFTAAIAASLTVSELETDIQGVGDLPRARVGAVQEAIGATYLSERNIAHRTYKSAEEGLKDLNEGRIDAFVHDAPLLQYMTNNEFSGSLQVLPETFDQQYYGIALPDGSPWREGINRALLEKAHGARWNQIVARYLGD